MNIAGRHLTNYLIKLLFMRGYAFNSTADFELVREIKEKYCFVTGNLELERKLAKETTIHEKEVRLPDGTCIKIGRERFEAAELLFNPNYGGYDFSGVSEMVFNSINNSPIDVRTSLYRSIMISGGTSMFPGFPTRL
jgi:actin-related protein 2